MLKRHKRILLGIFTMSILGLIIGCENNPAEPDEPESLIKTSSATYTDIVSFSGSQSSTAGAVFEILPGPAAMNSAMSPTPFSNNMVTTTGAYSFTLQDVVDVDSESSQDAVLSANITFIGNDGVAYKIDAINIIHKPDGMGDHTFFGGVGLNKMMHGSTGIGTDLMPRMMAYITLWGLVDLKDAATDTVVASNRVIHIMTGTRVRDENLNLVTSADTDSSDHNYRMAETHIILIPLDMQGNMDPVPGTDHGFLHMMFEEVELTEPSRDWSLVYEVLPGPAAINPAMNPTPFSDRIGLASGSYSLTVTDVNAEDSEDSEDVVDDFTLSYSRLDGTSFSINGINVIHKEEGTGDHTYFGGVGIDKIMHGDSGVGTNLMPKMKAHITLWGLVDLLDGEGNTLASDRLIHIMVASRARSDDLTLGTATATDETDHDLNKIETHIILPPLDVDGNMSPVAGTGHGFLHLMFEEVSL